MTCARVMRRAGDKRRYEALAADALPHGLSAAKVRLLDAACARRRRELGSM
jgi:hypothetical protein